MRPQVIWLFSLCLSLLTPLWPMPADSSSQVPALLFPLPKTPFPQVFPWCSHFTVLVERSSDHCLEEHPAFSLFHLSTQHRSQSEDDIFLNNKRGVWNGGSIDETRLAICLLVNYWYWLMGIRRFPILVSLLWCMFQKSPFKMVKTIIKKSRILKWNQYLFYASNIN